MKEKNLTQEENEAKNLFGSGYNCAETVSKVVLSHFDFDTNKICGVATGFGAGISRLGLTCGALTGGIISIGAVINSGFRRADQLEIKDKVTSKVQTLFKEFEEEFGTTNCRELTNCNFLTDEGLQKFSDSGIHSKVCEPLVTWTVKKSIELL